MPKISNKILDEKLRTEFLDRITAVLEQDGEEVLRTASNTIAIPCVDEEHNDKYLVITFKVPTGSRDGDAYDPYSEADAYKQKLETNAEKKAKADEKKAKKIAMDNARREQMAKAKAEREAKKIAGEG